jgi:hypothetical protein
MYQFARMLALVAVDGLAGRLLTLQAEAADGPMDRCPTQAEHGCDAIRSPAALAAEIANSALVFECQATW